MSSDGAVMPEKSGDNRLAHFDFGIGVRYDSVSRAVAGMIDAAS
jgi:hypothetical protein